MTNELYINGTKCDLPNGYTLPLKWQSNIFGDLSKIVGNKSATITLPFTPTNRSIFAIAEVPAIEGAKARQKLPARCVIDGVQVFGDGYAVLLSANRDSYEVALTWGVITNYNAFAADDTTLDEATWWSYNINGLVLMQKNPDPSTTASYPDWRYLTYYTEVEAGNDDNNVPPYLPSVLVKWMLDNIASHYGITFDIPAARRTFLDGLAVLLTSALITGSDEKVTAKVRTSSDPNVSYTILNSARNLISITSNPLMCGFTADCTVSYDETLIGLSPFSMIFDFYGSNTRHYEVAAVYDSGTYKANLKFEDEEVQAGDRFSIGIVDGSYNPIYSVNDYELQLTANSEAAMGYYMYITPNLPRLTAIDFIKEMALIAGVFAVDAQNNTLRFVTAEQLLIDTPQVLPDPIVVENVAFSYGDFAQNNELVYTTDDGGNNDGKGVIVVDDETLPVSNTMYESYFGLLYSRIWLHLYEKDDDEWKYLNPTQRLALISGGTAVVDGDLAFNDVLRLRLPTYAATLYKPVVVKCTIHMQLMEVVNIDLAKSVYINKLGRRYAILSIEQTARETYTFELIQLPA